jgi:hypothetical protein
LLANRFEADGLYDFWPVKSRDAARSGPANQMPVPERIEPDVGLVPCLRIPINRAYGQDVPLRLHQGEEVQPWPAAPFEQLFEIEVIEATRTSRVAWQPSTCWP